MVKPQRHEMIYFLRYVYGCNQCEVMQIIGKLENKRSIADIYGDGKIEIKLPENKNGL